MEAILLDVNFCAPLLIAAFVTGTQGLLRENSAHGSSATIR